MCWARPPVHRIFFEILFFFFNISLGFFNMTGRLVKHQESSQFEKHLTENPPHPVAKNSGPQRTEMAQWLEDLTKTSKTSRTSSPQTMPGSVWGTQAGVKNLVDLPVKSKVAAWKSNIAACKSPFSNRVFHAYYLDSLRETSFFFDWGKSTHWANLARHKLVVS